MPRRGFAALIAGLIFASLIAVPATASADQGGRKLPPQITAWIKADMARHGIRAEAATTAKAPAAPTAALGAGYPPCGPSCDSQDPATFYVHEPDGWWWKCMEDAQTIFAGETQSVELRYSPRCETTWARVMNYVVSPYIVSYYPNGKLRTWAGGFVNDSGDWSSMLDDHGYVNYACSVGEFGIDECTKGY